MSKIKLFLLNCLKYIFAVGIISGSITLGSYIFDYTIEFKQIPQSTTTQVINSGRSTIASAESATIK